MTFALNSIDELIEKAREQHEALGELLQRYQGYLRIIAEQEIGPRLGRRVDASDVVQQTFLKAHRQFEHFNGTSEPELSAWLRKILRNTIKDLVRDHLLTEKRAAGRERLLHDQNKSAAISWYEPAVMQSTASQKVIRGEQAIRLAQVLDSLPPDQRMTVKLRYIEGLSLNEIASRIERSPSATAGLLKRGLAALRQRMSERSWA